MTVNANSVFCSSFMLVGVGCEGELRFVYLFIVLPFFYSLAIFAISVQFGQTCTLAYDFFDLHGFHALTIYNQDIHRIPWT